MEKKDSSIDGLMFFYMMVMKMVLICFVTYVGLSYSTGVRWKKIQDVKTKNIPRTFERTIKTAFNLSFIPPKRIDSTNITAAFKVGLTVFKDSIKKEPLPNIWEIQDNARTQKLKSESLWDVGWNIGPLQFILPDSEGRVEIDLAFENIGSRFIELTLIPVDTFRFNYLEPYNSGLIPIKVIDEVEIIPLTFTGIAYHPIEIGDIGDIYKIIQLKSGEDITSYRSNFVYVSSGSMFFKKDGEFRIWCSRPDKKPARGDFSIKPNNPPLFFNNSNTLTINIAELGTAKYPNNNILLKGKNSVIKDPEDDDYEVKIDPNNPLDGASFEKYLTGDNKEVTVLNCDPKQWASRKTHEIIAIDKFGSGQSLYITIFK